MALFCVRYVRRKTSGRRFVLIVALLLLVEFGSSLELFTDLTLFLALGMALAVAAGAGLRGKYLRLAGLLVLAYVVLLPVLVLIALSALGGTHASLHFAPSNFAIDVANLGRASPTLLAGALHSARAISLHFVGNIGEQDGYLGVPLIVLALVALVREWRRGAWPVGTLFLCAVLLSFGPTLTVAGHPLLGLPFALSHCSSSPRPAGSPVDLQRPRRQCARRALAGADQASLASPWCRCACHGLTAAELLATRSSAGSMGDQQ